MSIPSALEKVVFEAQHIFFFGSCDIAATVTMAAKIAIEEKSFLFALNNAIVMLE